MRQIADSIQRFGFNNPVLVNDQWQIIAGHGRVAAAKLLGLDDVPTLRLAHLSKAEIRAYVIADNRLAEQVGWDREILAAELEVLIDQDFDVGVIGFDAGEVEIILEDSDAARREAAGPEDEVPELGGQAVTRPGDLWVLGRHRLLCGSALVGSDYDRLLDGEKAEFLFSDPPFNVQIAGHASRSFQRTHREFAVASGEMSEGQFTDFLVTVFRELVVHSANGAVHDHCMDWRHAPEMLAAGRNVYSDLLNICVWAKSHFGMGQFYRGQHEFVFVWRAGDASASNALPIAASWRDRSNVWHYRSMAHAGRSDAHGFYPTVKPVAMVADAIKDCSKRNAIVLDPFLGSGTTLIAAERTGRRGRGLDIDPLYVDTAVRRWQTYSGKRATLASTGQSFEEIEDERKAAADARAFASAPQAEAA